MLAAALTAPPAAAQAERVTALAYTVGTGFSGIGVPDLCARLLGMRTVWQIEREPFCQKVLRKNFPEVETLYGDIFDVHSPAYTDIQVYGFPCQPFSIAGKQLAEKDERFLIPEMLRIIDETRPRVVLLENVPRIASLNDGHTFKNLLQALAEMGMDAEWGHIRASDVGAPHTRERWFLVAYAACLSGKKQPRIINSETLVIPVDHASSRIEFGNSAERISLDGRIAAGQSAHVAYSNVNGNGIRRQRRSVSNENRNSTQEEQYGDELEPGVITSGFMGNSDGRRCEQCDSAERRVSVAYARRSKLDVPQYSRRQRGQSTWRGSNSTLSSSSAGAGTEIKSRLGRNLDGVAGWMDGFVPYPARPGEPQFAFEPPRVTTRTDDRAARLKALGNSMAVDVIFEIMLSIRTWLEASDLMVADDYAGTLFASADVAAGGAP